MNCEDSGREVVVVRGGGSGYWLVAGLEWTGGGELAEAAFAVAPGLIGRDGVSYDVRQVLGCADLYAKRHGLRVVFFSDLTRMFAGAGHSWAGLGVDWQAAVGELCQGPHPCMYLTVSERAYLVACDAGVAGSRGREEGREALREAVAERLAADWPGYVRG